MNGAIISLPPLFAIMVCTVTRLHNLYWIYTLYLLSGEAKCSGLTWAYCGTPWSIVVYSGFIVYRILCAVQ